MFSMDNLTKLYHKENTYIIKKKKGQGSILKFIQTEHSFENFITNHQVIQVHKTSSSKTQNGKFTMTLDNKKMKKYFKKLSE